MALDKSASFSQQPFVGIFHTVCRCDVILCARIDLNRMFSLLLGSCCGCSTGGSRRWQDSESMNCKVFASRRRCLGNCWPKNASQLTTIPKDIPEKIGKLEIVGSKIDAIKDADLQRLTCLGTLDLSDNEIAIMDANSFKNLQQLTMLNLSHNMISFIPSGFFSGQKILGRLFLNHNQLSVISADMFRGLVGLQLLNLQLNIISHVESDIFNFPHKDPQLQILLQGNRISEISGSWIQRFTHVYLENNFIRKIKTGQLTEANTTIYLSLSKNNISYLQKNVFFGLSYLTDLVLKTNILSFIENGAFNGLKSLRTLNLQQNNIQKIEPGTFLGLSSLYNLYLQSNHIQQLPNDTFFMLPKLYSLKISDNNISEIEQNAFSNLSVLHFLILSNNSIHTLHDETFANLAELYDLVLSWNKLRGFIVPKHVGFHHLDLGHNFLTIINQQTFTGLRGINKTGFVAIQMDFNRIFSIKQHTFLDCKSICKVYLQNNYLKRILDYTFEGLDYVSEIDLSCNEISIIEGFGNLSKLEKLNLSDNRLTEIHDLTFKYLYSLEDLYLARNNIVAISSSAFVLKMLERLKLQMNSITSLSWSVFYFNTSSSARDNIKDWVKLNLSYNVINKTTEHCWIKQGIEETWIQGTEETWIQTDIKDKELWNKSKIGCPNSGTHHSNSDFIVIMLRNRQWKYYAQI